MCDIWTQEDYIENVIIEASRRIAGEDDALKRRILARRLSEIVKAKGLNPCDSVNDASALIGKSLAETFSLGISRPKDYREYEEFKRAFERMKSSDLIRRDTSFAFGDDESNAEDQKSEEDKDGV